MEGYKEQSVVEETTEEYVDFNEEELDTIISDLTLEESDNPYVLGIIRGPFMVIGEDNGNGRTYLLETIKLRILDSAYVKRMIENKTLLGEPHHPIDRNSIWMDNACISITKLWLSKDNKILMGQADILDTPKGRLVYKLLKYGSRLGISARANGKGVKKGKTLVIRPENYFFKTFDMVLNPGFDIARPSSYEKDGTVINEEISELNEDALYEELKESLEKGELDKENVKEYIDYCDSKKLKELLPLLEEETPEGPTESEEELKNKVADLKYLVEELEEKEFVLLRANEELEGKVEKMRLLLNSLEEESNNQMENSRELRVRSTEFTELMEEEISSSEGKLMLLSSELEKKDRRIRVLLNTKNKLLEEIELANEEKKVLSEELSKMNEEYERDELLVDEPEEVKSKPIVKKDISVNPFKKNSVIVMNEEISSDIESSDRRVNLIKFVGGK